MTRDEAPPRTAEWTRRPERGAPWIMRLMIRISLRVGRRASRPILHGIALYFLAFAPAARRASRAYLRRALAREPGWRDLYRHFHVFACTIHDRVYLLNGRFDLFDIGLHGEEGIAGALAENRGIFLMGAHLGSFEAIRAVGRLRPGLRAAMLMYEENARMINALLADINPAAAREIIPMGRFDAMLKVRDRLEAGEWVGILADRTLSGERVRRLPFLGDEASLPLGPFRLAALLRQPAVFMLGLYQGGDRYEIHFEPLADFSQCAPEQREAAIAAAMRRYAELLESHCRRAPYNWFNFFDFWRAADAEEKP
jgi:predicted LPLAT superfamily acyltransferase